MTVTAPFEAPIARLLRVTMALKGTRTRQLRVEAQDEYTRLLASGRPSAAQAQHEYLYDQWGIRIAHCPNAEPHKWHGWAHFEDLRCPGVPKAASSQEPKA